MIFGIVVIPYLGLRILIHPAINDWFNFEGIIKNVPFLSAETTTNAFIANAHTVFLLLPLLILSWMNFDKHSQFLKVVSYITPFFIIVHYFLGNVIESLLWIPLFILLIPLSLNTLNLILKNQLRKSQDYLQTM